MNIIIRLCIKNNIFWYVSKVCLSQIRGVILDLKISNDHNSAMVWTKLDENFFIDVPHDNLSLTKVSNFSVNYTRRRKFLYVLPILSHTRPLGRGRNSKLSGKCFLIRVNILAYFQAKFVQRPFSLSYPASPFGNQFL